MNGVELVKDTTFIGTNISATKQLTIGKVASNDNFVGAIDEVRLWNVARTQTEIQSYMLNPLKGSEQGLIGYWQFEGNLNDATTNNQGLIYLGDVTNLAGTITASGENAGVYEGKAQAFDNVTSTKWLVSANKGWLQYQFNNNQSYVVTEYKITSANDVPTRDPKNWILQGSNDGSNWTNLDTRNNETFSSRFQTRSFTLNNSTSYSYYRLNITANNGNNSDTQLAEFQLFGGTPNLDSSNSINNPAPQIGYVEVKLDKPFEGLQGLWIEYDISAGTATQNIDYFNSRTRRVSTDIKTERNGIIIPKGETSARIYVSALSDAVVEGDENVTITLRPTNFDIFDANNDGNYVGTEWALKFDGVDDYISTTKSLMNNLSAFTMEGWVKADSIPTTGLNSLFGQNDVIEFGFSSQKLSVWTSNGGSLTADTSYPLNEWHHVAVVGNGQNVILYLDGVEVKKGGSATTNYGTSADTFKIGGGVWSTEIKNQFKGQISDVRIWNVARSQQDIQNNKNQLFNGNETGLVGYYKRHESVAQTLLDMTANNNNGTLQNGTDWTPYKDSVEYAPSFENNPNFSTDNNGSLSQTERDAIGYNYKVGTNSTAIITIKDNQAYQQGVILIDEYGQEVSSTNKLIVGKNGNATFQVKLTSQPTSAVTLTLRSDLGTLDKTSVTIQPSAWDTPQTVTLSGITGTNVSNSITVSVPNYLTPDATFPFTNTPSDKVRITEGSTTDAIAVTPVVTINKLNDVNEGDIQPGQFVINLSAPAPAAGLSIQYQLTGSAIAGTDYTPINTINIAPGETRAVIPVYPINDDIAEGNGNGNEQVTITLLNPATGYTLGSQTTATLNIIDDDKVGITLSDAVVSDTVTTYTGNFESLVTSEPYPQNGDILQLFDQTTGTLVKEITLTQTVINSGNVNIAANQAISFSGVKANNDSVQIPNITAINFDTNNNFTVETWVKADPTQPDTVNINNNIIEKWSGSGAYPFVIRYIHSTGKIQASRFDGSKSSTISSTAVINDNKWHHIAFSKNGTTLRLYIDGVEQGTGTFDLSTATTKNTSPLYLGKRGGNINYFKGSLDEVRIWNVPRSQQDIQNNKDRVLNGNESGLVAYYKANEGSGTTLIDSSSSVKKNHGTLQGTTTWQTIAERPLAGASLTAVLKESSNAQGSVNLGTVTVKSDGTVDVSLPKNDNKDTFGVRLSSKPTADVTITFNNIDSTEATFSESSLTFTIANWDQYQSVTITGLDDTLVDGDIKYTVTAKATSTDAKYNNVSTSIAITNLDDDDNIIKTSITNSSTGPKVSLGALTATQFTEGNQINLIVNLSQAAGTGGNLIFYSVDGKDFKYGEDYTVPAANQVYLKEKTDGVELTPTDITQLSGTKENKDLDGDGDLDLVVTNGTTKTNYYQFQAVKIAPGQSSATITVNTIDDKIDETDETVKIVLKAGTNYQVDDSATNKFVANLTFKDNDTAGVTITQPTGTSTGEDGSFLTYTVQLNSQPTNPVTVYIGSNDSSEGKIKIPTSSSESSDFIGLNFNSTNWNTPQTFQVVGINDAIADGTVPYNIITTVTSEDPNYNKLAIAPIPLTNTEDSDTAKIIITPPGQVIEGRQNVYSVKLNSQPVGEIRVIMTPKVDQFQLNNEDIGEPLTLTFNASNWNQTQTVRVTAVDDSVVEYFQTSQIEFKVETGNVKDFESKWQNNTPEKALDLGKITGGIERTGLTIDGQDIDWYKFTLPTQGTTNDFIVSQAQENLNLDLYSISDSSTAVKFSHSTKESDKEDKERIELNGLKAGDYLLKVSGSTTSNEYSLILGDADYQYRTAPIVTTDGKTLTALDVTIKDNDLPTAKIIAGPTASEVFGQPSYFTVQLNAPAPLDGNGIVVGYKVVGGSATLNTDATPGDYRIQNNQKEGTVRIAPGEIQANIIVSPVDDKLVEDLNLKTISRDTSFVSTSADGKTTLRFNFETETPFDTQYEIPNGSLLKFDNGVIGTLEGKATFTDTFLNFDGKDDYIATTQSLMNNLSSFTMEGWVKANSLREGESVSLFGQNDVIEFGFSSQKLSVWTQKGGGYLFSADTTYPLNEWHHVAVVGNGQNVILYLDGVKVKTGGSPTTNYGTSADPFKIGAEVWDQVNKQPFNGQIDEVRIWNLARTEQEIKDNLNKPLNSSKTGLIAYYQANESTGINLIDSSVNKLNGTLQNGVSWQGSQGSLIVKVDNQDVSRISAATKAKITGETVVVELLPDYSEDLNGNGILDAGEDLNGNSILEVPTYTLGGEDTNLNSKLDQSEDTDSDNKLDPDGNTSKATLSIQDDDVPGIRIVEVGNHTVVRERETATFEVSLLSEPAKDTKVEITLTPGAEIEFVNPINPTTFQVDKDVYSFAPNTDTKNLDVVIKSLVFTDKGDTVAFDVKLKSKPNGTVTVVFDDGNNDNNTQPVIVTFTDQAINPITGEITDGNWNQVQQVVIYNLDKLATYKDTNSNGQLDAGDDLKKYQIQATINGQQPINIPINHTIENEKVQKQRTTLTIQPEDWYKLQTVTIKGSSDDVTEPGIYHADSIKYTVKSADKTYNGIFVPNQTIHVVDRVIDAKQTANTLGQGLKTLQDSMDNLSLPLIGSLDGVAPDPIAAFSQDLVNAISSTENLTASKLKEIIENVLGKVGLDAFTVTTEVTDNEISALLDIKDSYQLFKLPLSTDLGIPALGIGLETEGDLQANFNYNFSLGFGLHDDFGFYIDTDKTGFKTDVTVDLDQFKGQGSLGFLKLDFADDANNPSKLQVSFEAGLNDLDNSQGVQFFDDKPNIVTVLDDGSRLTITELVKAKKDKKLSSLFNYQFAGEANLGLNAKTSINNNTNFPSVSVDLAVNLPLFNYGNQDEAGSNGLSVDFNNITVDLGGFISDVVKPVIDTADKIITPIKPIIQVLNADTKIFGYIGLESTFDTDGKPGVSILEIAKKLNSGDPRIDKAIKFAETVTKISEIVDLLKDSTTSTTTNTITINQIASSSVPGGSPNTTSAPGTPATNLFTTDFDSQYKTEAKLLLNNETLSTLVNDLNPNNFTFVITHGFQSSVFGQNPQFRDLGSAIHNYFKSLNQGVNVVLWDWSTEASGSPLEYQTNANKVDEIGEELAKFLQAGNINPSKTQLIGHSLGAHVMGNAGESYKTLTGKSINSIVGLDPAGPLFESDFNPATLSNDTSNNLDLLTNRLDDSDGDRVVALHTSNTLGFDGNLADLDLFVNWSDLTQPGAFNFLDNHSYATQLYTQLTNLSSFSQDFGNSEEKNSTLVGNTLDINDIYNTALRGSDYVTTGVDTIAINFGSYSLDDFKAASKDEADAAASVKPGSTAGSSQNSAKTTSKLKTDTESQANNSSKGSLISKLKGLEGLDFPILTSPTTAISLLLGESGVDLVTYDIPDFAFDFNIQQNFPIFGPISGLLEGSFSAKTDLSVGYDTYGIEQWQKSDFSLEDAYKVLDGFYLSDLDKNGYDKDEFSMRARIAAGAGIDVFLLSAFVKGGLDAYVGFDLNDVGEQTGTSDGKVRGSEIISRLDTPLELFELYGDLSAFLNITVKALGINVFNQDLARIKIAEFSIGANGISGSVGNAPQIGSLVYWDVNFNSKFDGNEPFTFTDGNGNYILEIPQEYDLNRNGTFDNNEGQIVAEGGIDTTTGLTVKTKLIASADSAMVTPLTTLKSTLIQQGLTGEEANNLIKTIFNLSSDVNIDKYNPFAAIGENDINGVEIATDHIKVMNLLLNGISFLENAGYQSENAETQVIIALKEVQQTVESFSLSNSDHIKLLLTKLNAKLANPTISQETLAEIAKLVANSNHLVEDISQQALDRSISDVLPSIAPIKKTVYTSVPALTAQLVKGEITPEEAETELDKLLNANTFLVEYQNFSANRTVKVITNDTLTEGVAGTGHFTIELGAAAPSQGLKILYTLSGTATLGQDYSFAGSNFGEIIIKGGETQAILDVSAIDDTLKETKETISLNLKYVGNGYILDPIAKTALITINDNEADSVNSSQKGLESNGTSGNDTIIGTDQDDILKGGNGNDSLTGNAGNDILDGGAGNDSLNGGDGADILEGRSGTDSLNGGAGDDKIFGGMNNDILVGGMGNDQLQGDAGNDQLQGNEGNDVLDGGTGNDYLTGNEDNDWLLGGAGEDILEGGEGADLLNGGEGADVFYYSSPTQGIDFILDFDPSQGDIIQISKTGFGVNSLEQFSFLVGTLQFNGVDIALIQNDGQTYNTFPNLANIIQLVDEPTFQTAVISESSNNSQTVYSPATVDMVEKPNLTIYDEIINRGYLKVATSSQTTDFDREFTKILAAAIFGDATKIEFVNADLNSGFELVSNKIVDIGANHTIKTAEGDLAHNVDFSSTYFYDHNSTKEAIGLIVPENDSQWADVVRWVTYVPMQAEEFGITSANIAQVIALNTDDNPNNDSEAGIRRFLGIEGNLGEGLGLPNNFAAKIIEDIGNYGEIYERHFPEVERERNLLWTEGGLIYSPPFSGTSQDLELMENSNRNVLTELLKRGKLIVGTNGRNPGFSFPNGNGNLVGFDVDLSKALASALFGNTQAVEFRQLNNRERFTDVANGVVDISIHQVTHDLVRDGQYGVDFTPIYFYTEQGVLTRKDNGVVNLPDLNGRKIGVSAGTNSAQNLEDIFKKYGITAEIIKFTTAEELSGAYLLGKIDAISLDTPLLYAAMAFLPDPDNHHLLNANISKQPLAMVIDENQSDWGDVVRWVTHGLVQAQEYGITSQNIDEILARNTDNNPSNNDSSEIRQFLGLEGNIGQMLGLSSDWAVKMVKAVGNYGEIYQRHFNTDVLRRGQNELATDFGLQTALPLRAGEFQEGSDPITKPQDLVSGTPGNDKLMSPIDLDGEQDIVFTGAGDDEVDVSLAPVGDNNIFGGSGADTIYVSKSDRVFGDVGNDIFYAIDGKGGNRMSGGAGNDTFFLGAGDRALGGEGNDIFYLQQGGGNLISGGAGADKFYILTGDIPATTNTIIDFDMGTDVLGIRGQGAGFDFNDLTLIDNSIIVGNTTIAILNGVDTTRLTATNFSFI